MNDEYDVTDIVMQCNTKVIGPFKKIHMIAQIEESEWRLLCLSSTDCGIPCINRTTSVSVIGIPPFMLSEFGVDTKDYERLPEIAL